MPARSHVIIGVRKGASRVDVAVIPTDRARSPFARYVITLDAVPPGQQPTRITPSAKSSGIWNRRVRSHAVIGMMVN